MPGGRFPARPLRKLVANRGNICKTVQSLLRCQRPRKSSWRKQENTWETSAPWILVIRLWVFRWKDRGLDGRENSQFIFTNFLRNFKGRSRGFICSFLDFPSSRSVQAGRKKRASWEKNSERKTLGREKGRASKHLLNYLGPPTSTKTVSCVQIAKSLVKEGFTGSPCFFGFACAKANDWRKCWRKLSKLTNHSVY